MYFHKIDQVTENKNLPIFISSDDFNVIKEAKSMYPDRDIYSFEFESDAGYFMHDFLMNYDEEQQKAKIVRLLAQVEILKNADYFVGTYSTNVAVFIGMARNCRDCYDVNDSEWELW